MTSQGRFDQLFSEILIKTVNLILRQRVIFPVEAVKEKSSKWLNLRIEEIKELTEIIHKKILKAKKKSMCLDVFIETEIKQEGRKEALKYRGGIARNFDKERRKKRILLERWVLKCVDDSNENAALPIGYKKAIAMMRALYSYVLLLPAFDLYQENVRNRMTARLMKFEIFESPEDSPLCFDNSDEFGSFQFSTIETQVKNITFEMQYRYKLTDLPKAVPSSILGDVKDSYMDNMIDKVGRARTHSLPPPKSKTIDIKNPGKTDHNISPQARSTPRDIPTHKIGHSARKLFQDKSPPFSNVINSLESSPGSMGHSSSPPFDYIGRSSSYKGSKPRLGSKVSPYDSPALGDSYTARSLPHHSQLSEYRRPATTFRQSSFKRDTEDVPSVFMEKGTPQSMDRNSLDRFQSISTGSHLSPDSFPENNSNIKFHTTFMFEDLPDSPVKMSKQKNSPDDQQFAFLDDEQMDQEEQLGAFLNSLEEAPNLTTFQDTPVTTMQSIITRFDRVTQDFQEMIATQN